MSDRIGFLKDEDGNNLYPKTVAEAVYLSNDHDLERELNNCQKYSDFHAYNSLESIGLSHPSTLLQISQALGAKAGGVVYISVALGMIDGLYNIGTIPTRQDGVLEVVTSLWGAKGRAIYTAIDGGMWLNYSGNSYNDGWSGWKRVYAEGAPVISGGYLSASRTDGTESNVVASQKSGSILLYAQENASGSRSSRGIYGLNPNGQGVNVLAVGPDNVININGEAYIGANRPVVAMNATMTQSTTTTCSVPNIPKNACYFIVVGANGGAGAYSMQPNLYMLSIANETPPSIAYYYLGGSNNTAQKINGASWNNNTLTLTMSAANARVNVIRMTK